MAALQEDDDAFSSLLYYTVKSDPLPALKAEAYCAPSLGESDACFEDNNPFPIVPVSGIVFKTQKRHLDDEDTVNAASSFHGPAFKRGCPTLPDSELYFPKKSALGK